MSSDPQREAAIQRLNDKRGFKTNLLMFVLVNAVLWAIWGLSDHRGFPWPVFVTFFWGIGVIGHAWAIWGQKPITEDDIEREMKRGGDATG